MQNEQINLLRASWQSLKDDAEQTAEQFQDNLWEQDPEAINTFKYRAEFNPARLVEFLEQAISVLDQPNQLNAYIRATVRKYSGYKLCKQHQQSIHKAMQNTLRHRLGDADSSAIETAWSAFYQRLSGSIIQATDAQGTAELLAEEAESMTTAASNQSNAFFKNTIDAIRSAVMAVDESFTITYLNNGALRLFKHNVDAFREQYPDFEPEALVGKNIDIFHKNPAHQRALLKDLSRLPYETEVRIGDLTFSLYADAVTDASGKHVGNLLEWTDITAQKQQIAEVSGQLSAISKAQAVIEFNLDGTIITANENFLATVGYTLEEIQGQHHSMFIEQDYKQCIEYRLFWEKLNRGEYEAGEYKRIAKGGREFWIQASYNPILDLYGQPYKVVKYATDITAQKLRNADYAGQIEAIGKAQAVIEFDMDGMVLDANHNFLTTLGYQLDEIKGQHHSLFVDPEYRNSNDYRLFWEKLKRGEYDAAEYKRIGKGGTAVWIQATYNPIFDLNGKPFKVVKYATDITKRKQAVETIKNALLSASKGQLNCEIEETLVGEFAILGDAMNALINNLSNMVTEIRQASGNVFSAAREIAQGNDDLSQRTESQASSLEETASAMEELTTTVQKNAENAGDATDTANSAMSKASNGGKVIQSAVSAMEDINKSSKKIADIIGVIDEIAFQTNLLALNAAVEAARAGEQGRGFAVVAAEVRSLAQRSAAAAKEIKALINDSVEAVGKGSKLVDETGQTFNELIEAVSEVVTRISDINNASKEQASGINEVNSAVAQMDEMTQQNAALVEQAAASSRSMEEQAQSLIQQVGFFRTSAEEAEISRIPVKDNRQPPKLRAMSSKPEPVAEEEWQEF